MLAGTLIRYSSLGRLRFVTDWPYNQYHLRCTVLTFAYCFCHLERITLICTVITGSGVGRCFSFLNTVARLSNMELCQQVILKDCTKVLPVICWSCALDKSIHIWQCMRPTYILFVTWLVDTTLSEGSCSIFVMGFTCLLVRAWQALTFNSRSIVVEVNILVRFDYCLVHRLGNLRLSLVLAWKFHQLCCTLLEYSAFIGSTLLDPGDRRYLKSSNTTGRRNPLVNSGGGVDSAESLALFSWWPYNCKILPYALCLGECSTRWPAACGCYYRWMNPIRAPTTELPPLKQPHSNLRGSLRLALPTGKLQTPRHATPKILLSYHHAYAWIWSHRHWQCETSIHQKIPQSILQR